MKRRFFSPKVLKKGGFCGMMLEITNGCLSVDSHFIFSNNPQIKLSNKTNPFQNKISYFQIVFPFFAK